MGLTLVTAVLMMPALVLLVVVLLIMKVLALALSDTLAQSCLHSMSLMDSMLVCKRK